MRRTTKRGRLSALAALAAGGSLFTTCQSQFRDSVVFGTQNYFLNVILDPETVISAILGIPEDSGDDESP